MTIFEYIKQKATKEEIAKMFTFLENDSGYYNENDKMYNLVMKYLNKEIGDK